MVMSGGEILLEVFKNQGIEYIFCSPGTEWLPVWEGIARRYSQGDKTFKYINCRHENTAVSMALGYAKATGRLPAVLLHDTVGPLNGALAIRAAYRSKTPMLICSGDTLSFGEDGRGAGWQWLPNLSDIEGPDAMVRPYVKWSKTVKSAETLLDSVGRGCAIAQAAPKGPVFLTIPWEFQINSQPEIKNTTFYPSVGLPEPSPGDLEEVARQLLESKQPLIITEHSGENPEAVPKLVELAELLSIPVFECVSPRFTNFPKNHPLYMGNNASEALKEADTLLLVGSTMPWYPISSGPQNSAKIILMDEDPLKQQLPYWGYRIDLSLVSDLAQGLAALTGILRTSISHSKSSDSFYRERFERWQTKHEQLVESWKTEALSGQRNIPISTRWFLYTAGRILPRNSIILDETITHKAFIQRYTTHPNAYRSVTGGLGIGLGVAAGTKLAYPDRPVIFFVGDGTFNYNPVLAGFGVCQEYHLPILTVVMNNGSYAAMKSAYKQYYPQGVAVSNDIYLGIDINPQPGYAKVAEAFDGYGERVGNPEDIEPALNRALEQMASGRVTLLDVMLEIKDSRRS
ncbi:thiamine pyrophosphate-dependent enzyme [Chloroflexota bacterium]